MATISDANERNISTVNVTPYGIRSGSTSQINKEASISQKEAASAIKQTIGTQAVERSSLSPSAIDNLNAVTAMALNPYRKENQLERHGMQQEEAEQTAAAQNWLSTFEQTIAPYVRLTEAEKRYYDRMSRVYIEQGTDPATFAEDFLTANAISNVTGMNRQDIVTYADQLSDYFLGQPAQRNMTWGRNLINAWQQGTRQQELFKLQDEYRQLFAEGYTDNDSIVQYKLNQIQALQEEIDYNTDATPHNWLVNWVSDGIAQVPYMLSGLGAGAIGTAAGAAIGSLIPVVGTKIGATVGNYLGRFISYRGSFSGNSFYEMKQAGISNETALRLSDAEGTLNALNESLLDAVSDTLIGAIGGNVVKTVLYPNIFKKLAVKGSIRSFAGQVALYLAGQGTGEFFQEATQSLTTSAFIYAAEEMDNIPHTKTASQALNEALQEGVAGFAVGLLFGLPGSVVATVQDVRSSASLFDKAVETPSRETFANSQENISTVKSMKLAANHFSDSDARSELGRMWDNAANARSNRLNARVEVAGGNVTTKEGKKYSKLQLTPEKLDGRLRSETSVDYSDDAQKTAQLIIDFGGVTPVNSEGAAPRYGTVRMSVDHANHTAVINSISINPGYESQAQEMVRQAIQDNAPGYTVSWDTDVDLEKAVKEALIRDNPKGIEAGLTYEASTNTGREAEIAEYSSRIRNTFTNLSDREINATVHVLDVLARHHNMTISQLEERYAGGNFFIHGDPAVAQRAQGQRGAYRPLSMQQIAQGVRGVIYAGENADTSTFLHELFHFAADIDESGRRQLSSAVKRMANENAAMLRQFINDHGEIFADKNVDRVMELFSNLDENDRWSTELNEAMTSLYEAWTATHDAANLTPEVKGILEKIADFMRQVYQTIKGNAKLDADVQAGFERIMGYDGSTIASSEQQTRTSEETLYQSDRAAETGDEFEQTEKELRSIASNFDDQGRHLAPNGKPSNLPYRQWVMVRTPSFKKWFGDWLDAANIEWLINSEPNAILTGEEFKENIIDNVAALYETYDNRVYREGLGYVTLTRHDIQSSVSHGLGRKKAAAFAAVPDIIREGREFNRTENYKNRGYDSIVIAAPISIAGEAYVCEVVLNKRANSNNFYLHEVEVRNKLQFSNQVRNYMDENHPNRNTKTGASRLIISKLFAEGKFTASKVIDENGEPKIVYHGTPRAKRGEPAFTEFRIDNGDEYNRGAYFSDDISTADTYTSSNEPPAMVDMQFNNGDWINVGGSIYPVFLNIKTPLIINAEGRTWLDVYGNNIDLWQVIDNETGDEIDVIEGSENIDAWINAHPDLDSDSYSIDYLDTDESNSQTTRDVVAQAVRENSYDGVIFNNIVDGGEEISTVYTVLDSPSQIKSIDNQGAFSPENEDILFQTDKDYSPKKTGHGYKLFEQDTRTGKLYPLFIGSKEETPIGEWLIAQNIPTKGFANRPGWHIGSSLPDAPWLKGYSADNPRGVFNSKRGKNFRRVWAEVSYPMDVDYQEELDRRGIKDIKDHTPENGYYTFREANGTWIIAGALRVDRILTEEERQQIFDEAGYDEQQAWENAPSYAHRKKQYESANNILFQSGDGKTRITNTLFVTHTLTDSNLKSSVEIGGFVMPSLGITKPVLDLFSNLQNFGNITLIGNRDLGIQLIKEGAVYDRDIWSPVFPRPEYTPNTRKLEAFIRKLNQYAISDRRKLASIDAYSKFQYADPDDFAGRLDGNNAHLAYAAEHKIPYETVYTHMPTSEYTQDFIVKAKAWLVENEKRLKTTGYDTAFENDMWNALRPYMEDSFRERFGEDFTQRELAKANNESPSLFSKLDPSKAAKRNSSKIWDKVLLDENLGYRKKDMYSLMQMAESYDPDAVIVDENATITNLNHALKGHDVRAWVREQLEDAYSEPFLRIGREKVSITAENILRYMTRQKLIGNSGYFDTLSSAASNSARSLNTLKALHDAESLLGPKREGLDNKFFELVRKYLDIDNSFEAMDGMIDIIGSYLKKTSGLNKAVMRRLIMNEQGLVTRTNETADAFADFAERLRNETRPYFEAKPKRIMQLSDFSAAVVTDTVSDEAKEILADAGLPIIESNRENFSQDVINYVQQNASDLLFQSDIKNRYSGFFSRPISEVQATIETVDTEINEEAQRDFENSISTDTPVDIDDSMSASNIRDNIKDESEIKPWTDNSWWIDENGELITSEEEYNNYLTRFVKPLIKGRFANLFHHNEEQSIDELISSMKPAITFTAKTEAGRDQQFIDMLKNEETFRRIFGLLGEIYYLNTTVTNAQRIEVMKKINGKMRPTQETQVEPYVDQRAREELQKKLQAVVDNPAVISVMRQAVKNEAFSSSASSTKSRAMKAIAEDARLYRNMIANILNMPELRPEKLADNNAIDLPRREDMDAMSLSQAKTLLANNTIDVVLRAAQNTASTPEEYSQLASVALLLKTRLSEADTTIENLKGKDRELSAALEERDNIFASIERWLEALASLLGLSNVSASRQRKNEIKSILYDLNGEKRYQNEATDKGARERGKAIGVKRGTREWLKDMAAFYPQLKPETWINSKDYETQLRNNINLFRQQLIDEDRSITPANVNYLVDKIREFTLKQNDEMKVIKGSLSKLLIEANETVQLAKRSKINSETGITQDGFTIGDTESGETANDGIEESSSDNTEPVDESLGIPRLAGSEDSKDSQLVEVVQTDSILREVMKRYGAYQQSRIEDQQAYADETSSFAASWATGEISDEDMENFREEITQNPRLYRRRFSIAFGRTDMAARQQGGLPPIETSENAGGNLGARGRRSITRQTHGIDTETAQSMTDGSETLDGHVEAQLKKIGKAIKEIKAQIKIDQRKIENRDEKISQLRNDIAAKNRQIRSLNSRLEKNTTRNSESIDSLYQELSDLRNIVHDLEIQMAAEERHAETEKRNLEAKNTRLKERQAEEREYRKLREYKLKLAKSIFRKWTRSVDFRTVAPLMKYVRETIDPSFRQDWAYDPTAETVDGQKRPTVSINELRELYTGIDAGQITDIDKAELKSRLGSRLYNRISGEGAKPLNDWSVIELEELKTRLDEVWEEGRLIQKAKDEAKRNRRKNLRNDILESVKSAPKYNDDPELTGTGESTKRKRSLKTEMQGNYYATKRMQELAYFIDGNKGQRGTAYDLLVEQVRTMLDEEYINEQRRMKPYELAIKTYRQWLKDNGIKENADEILFHKQYTVDLGDRTVHYNLSALAYIYLSQFNAKARDAVAYGSLVSAQEKGHLLGDDSNKRIADFGGMNEHILGDDEIKGIGDMRYKAALARAEAILNETGAMSIVDAIRDDLWSRDNAQRVFNFSLDVFNQPVVLEENYLFVHRLDAQGNRPETVKDINMAVGQALETIEKGFLEEKKTIAPANQVPANLDLFGGWVDSMQQQEHLLAGGRLLSDLRATFETNREVVDVIRRKFGDGMVTELRDYIAHVADPHYSDVRNDVSRVINFLRGSVSTAYLGFKLSSIIVQVPTSLAPFLGSVKTGSLLKSFVQILAHPSRTWNFITDRSVRMERRTPTIMIEDIQKEARKQGKGQIARTWARFNEIGMKGLEWIDKLTVGAGWLAKYYDVLDKAISRGDDTAAAETAAIKAADDLVYEIQPVADKTEVARLFRSNNAILKMFLQFQQAMNVVYNNVSTDTHQQWKNRKADSEVIKRIIGRLIGYAGAGIILGLVQQGFDDDDDDLDKIGKLAYWGISQGVDSIPVVGSIASGITSAILTGQFDSYTMEENILPFASDLGSYGARLITALRSEDGPDIERALSAAEGIALSLGTAIGAPTSTIKQIIRSIEQESFMPMLGRY